jgi:hypothetical protein
MNANSTLAADVVNTPPEATEPKKQLNLNLRVDSRPENEIKQYINPLISDLLVNRDQSKEPIADELADDSDETNNASTQKQEEKQRITPNDEFETIKKRFQDAQSMIGKQGNEIGELRKQNEEMRQMVMSIQTTTNNNKTEKPYYMVIEEATADELAQSLKKSNGATDELNDDYWKGMAATLKSSVKIAKDIVSDYVKPFQPLVESNKAMREYQQKETEFLSERPDFSEYKNEIRTLMTQAYPEYDYETFLSKVRDPFGVLDSYYRLAKVAKQTGNGEEIVAKQSQERMQKQKMMNSSAQGAASSGSSSKPKDLLRDAVRKNFADFIPK